MKKYAITCPSPFGTLWYYEEDLPNEWWTSKKSKAMLFNNIAGAESKALLIVSKNRDLVGKVALFEGEEEEFGRKAPLRGDLSQGLAGDVLGSIFDSLFGGTKRGRSDRSGQAPEQDRPPEGEGGPPPAT